MNSIQVVASVSSVSDPSIATDGGTLMPASSNANSTETSSTMPSSSVAADTTTEGSTQAFQLQVCSWIFFICYILNGDRSRTLYLRYL